MRPAAWELSGRPGVGGSCCRPALPLLLLLLPVFLLLCLGSAPRVAGCPASCLCASDIVSCSGRNLSAPPFDLPGYATRLDLSHNALAALRADWISRPLDRLATLVLGKNRLGRIEAGAFAWTPRLLHLDLSSNGLTALNSSVFAGLTELRELLLFGNRIAAMEPGSFGELRGLRRLYLSANRLTSFPLELYEDAEGPRNLTFLDLSYNRLTAAPVQSLLALTQRGGIYLQGNPLVCDCATLGLLEFWTWKQYRPLLDFRGEYPCKDGVGPRFDCQPRGVLDTPLEAQTYQIEPGSWFTLPCPGWTSPAPEGQIVFWTTPTTALNSSAADAGARLTVLPNGTLEIHGALAEDSGTYACVAARGRQYDPGESPEVTVAVGNQSGAPGGGGGSSGNRSGAEHFNTAFTTLASCVVSIILVLLYLYLTPCRCRDGGGARGCGGRAISLCSDPREAESGQRRSNGKRVAFMEPQAEETSISDPKTPAVNSGHGATEGILKNGSRTVEQTFTNASQKV